MGGATGGVAQAGIGGLQLLEAKRTADAIKRQAQFNAQQAEYNAQLVELQKGELLAQVDNDVDRRQREVKRILGSQKTVLAAQGIEVEGELGEIFEADERQIALEDVQAIKNNGWRSALGLEMQAQDLRTQAKFGLAAGESQARSSLVTGGLQGIGNISGGLGQVQSSRIRRTAQTNANNRLRS